MSKLETNQVDPATGTTLTLGTSGDTISIPSGVTIANSGTATGFGETMTPAFLANLSGDQTIGDNSYTKLTFNTEVFDTDNMFDNSSNYRFTPTTAGKYYVYVKGRYISSADYDNNVFNIYKNGSNYAEARNSNIYYNTCFIGVIVTFNGSSDYVEAYTQQGSGGNLNVSGGTTHQARAEFGAYKLIGV